MIGVLVSSVPQVHRGTWGRFDLFLSRGSRQAMEFLSLDGHELQVRTNIEWGDVWVLTYQLKQCGH
jgi:hypothetical protein